MKVSEGARYFVDYHRMHSKKNTLRNYEKLISLFCDEFGERETESISTDEILNSRMSH